MLRVRRQGRRHPNAAASTLSVHDGGCSEQAAGTGKQLAELPPFHLTTHQLARLARGRVATPARHALPRASHATIPTNTNLSHVAVPRVHLGNVG